VWIAHKDLIIVEIHIHIAEDVAGVIILVNVGNQMVDGAISAARQLVVEQAVARDTFLMKHQEWHNLLTLK
jgi:hypothetical protein